MNLLYIADDSDLAAAAASVAVHAPVAGLAGYSQPNAVAADS